MRSDTMLELRGTARTDAVEPGDVRHTDATVAAGNSPMPARAMTLLAQGRQRR